MQKTWCDDCGKELKLDEKDKPEIAGSDWKPDVLVRLEMRVVGKGIMPVDMDLCVRCAKRYMKVLRKPMESED